MDRGGGEGEAEVVTRVVVGFPKSVGFCLFLFGFVLFRFWCSSGGCRVAVVARPRPCVARIGGRKRKGRMSRTGEVGTGNGGETAVHTWRRKRT